MRHNNLLSHPIGYIYPTLLGIFIPPYWVYFRYPAQEGSYHGLGNGDLGVFHGSRKECQALSPQLNRLGKDIPH